MQTTLLIVDDDPRNIFALTAVLTAKNYNCLQAENAEQALSILTEQQPSAVLLDMMMPGKDGYETIAAIKADDAIKNIPIIAVTAQAMQGDREKCLEAGADGYVAKPIDIDLLLAELAKFL